MDEAGVRAAIEAIEAEERLFGDHRGLVSEDQLIAALRAAIEPLEAWMGMDEKEPPCTHGCHDAHSPDTGYPLEWCFCPVCGEGL